MKDIGYKSVSLCKKNNRILKVLDKNEIKKINSAVELFFSEHSKTIISTRK